MSLLGALASGAVAAAVLAILPQPQGSGRVVVLSLELTLACAAALGTYLAYSRVVRLPELPRTVGLLRAAIRPG